MRTVVVLLRTASAVQKVYIKAVSIASNSTEFMLFGQEVHEDQAVIARFPADAVYGVWVEERECGPAPPAPPEPSAPPEPAAG